MALKPMDSDSQADAETASIDTEPAMGTAGTIASLANLLAGQAERLPPSREALLDAAGRDALRDLRPCRTAQLNREIDKLE